MSTLDETAKIVRDLGAAYDIEGLSLDENGDCSLLVDQKTDIFFHFDEVNQRVIIESIVGELPSENQESILISLMRGNRLGVETLGGTLSLSPKNQILFLRELPHKKLNLSILERAIDMHITATLDWKERLEGNSDTETPSSEAPSDFDKFDLSKFV